MAGERTQRKTRTPIEGHSRSRLRVTGKDAKYEYYIANDLDNRIEVMKEAGWEVVTEDSVKIGDRRIGAASAEGSAKTVSVGGGVTGVLMRIPKEWYEEDQARKNQEARSMVDETLKDAKSKSDYGTVKLD